MISFWLNTKEAHFLQNVILGVWNSTSRPRKLKKSNSNYSYSMCTSFSKSLLMICERFLLCQTLFLPLALTILTEKKNQKDFVLEVHKLLEHRTLLSFTLTSSRGGAGVQVGLSLQCEWKLTSKHSVPNISRTHVGWRMTRDHSCHTGKGGTAMIFGWSKALRGGDTEGV